MAVNTMPEKRFKYILKDDVTAIEEELSVDPKGWDNHEVGFERSEDFGLNIQNIVPLSFSGAARAFIKSRYESKGIFGKSSTLIEKRGNNWAYAPFYNYKHDYSTYKDNLHFVEIAGIEDGLAKKFDTYKDTEYEIDLPTNKTFIAYTGAKYTTSNQIQAGAGKLDEKQTMPEDFYVLKGTRSVRAYNNKIAFTDANGLPYTTMTFRALQTDSISLNVFLKLTIEADAAFTSGTPSVGTIKLVKHTADFTPIGNINLSIIKSYTPYSTSTPSNNRIDVFDTTDLNLSVSVVTGELYSFFYDADETCGYEKVSVTEGGMCYIDISNMVDSAYQNVQLEVFTYEWLISQLLAKIDNTAISNSTVTYPYINEVLTCTACISNMGATSGVGKIKTTLSDVLESFNKLKCIAIDITGNIMTISDRAAVYPPDSYGSEITVNDIVVEHSVAHQYNKITVGADTEDREADDPLVYPFICEKEFIVEDTIAENELNLVNNFMLDPYDIDKYIIKTLSNRDIKDECKFAVFAIGRIPDNYEIEPESSWEETIISDEDYTSIEARAYTQYFELGANAIIHFAAETDYTGGTLHKYTVYLEADGYNYMIKTDSGKLDATNFSFRATASTQCRLIVIQEATTEEDTVFLTARITGTPDISIDYSETSQSLYRRHTITGFSGDANTIYNIPLTPKRILERHIKYLAISVVGKDTKKLKFGTTTIKNSGITSKCHYEVANVVENGDLELTGITPLFSPTTISANTTETILTIPTFENKKYKYLSFKDEKTNKIYEGWINSVTFAISKNKSKSIVLQGKTI